MSQEDKELTGRSSPETEKPIAAVPPEVTPVPDDGAFVERTDREDKLDAEIRRVLDAFRLRYAATTFAFEEALARRKEKGGWKDDDPVVVALKRQRALELQKLAIFENNPSENNNHEAISALRALESMTVVDGDDGIMELDREWYLEQSLIQSLKDFAETDEEVRAKQSTEELAEAGNDLETKAWAYRNTATHDERAVALAALKEARRRYQDLIGVEDPEISIDLVVSKEGSEELYREASAERMENELIRRIRDTAGHTAPEDNVWVRRAKALIPKSRDSRLTEEERVGLLKEMHQLLFVAKRTETTDLEAARARTVVEMILHERYAEGVLPDVESRLRKEWTLINEQPEYHTGHDRAVAFRELLTAVFRNDGFSNRQRKQLVHYFLKRVGI